MLATSVASRVVVAGVRGERRVYLWVGSTSWIQLADFEGIEGGIDECGGLLE